MIALILITLSWLTPVGAADAPAAATVVVAPWAETQSRMLNYKGQRQALMGDMRKLREEQMTLKMGSVGMKTKAAELSKKYKEYKEMTEEYNKLLMILRYRFPERLAKETLKTHTPEEVPTLEELEVQLDLDARLNNTLNRARQQYGGAEETKARKPSSVDYPGTSEEIAPSLRELPPVKLSK